MTPRHQEREGPRWRPALSPNALGALYMTLGTLAYVINDGFIRLAAEEGLDVYQALFLRGCAMIAVFATLLRVRGERLDRRLLVRPLVLRVAGEVVATATFFAALLQLDFANAQTILMLVPFAVTVVAGRSLGERVTPYRYLLVAIGFAGVVAVIRPTPSAFSPWSLLVVVSAVAYVGRELATRRVPSSTPPLAIALLTAIAITTMAGLLSIVGGWGAMSGAALAYLATACTLLIAGYLFTIETVRVGDLSVSAPFRYVAVVGSVAVGALFFAERPDWWTAVGCAVIVLAGVASAREEARTARPAATGTPAGSG
ncbi:MAG: DMT family transporter [Actinomycetota bacterium]